MGEKSGNWNLSRNICDTVKASLGFQQTKYSRKSDMFLYEFRAADLYDDI